MEKQIKLPDTAFVKDGNIIVEVYKTAGKFIGDHISELFVSALAVVVTIDNIRVRLGRKKDQKTFVENISKQQQVIKMHEAEINVLKEEADQEQKAMQMLGQLVQIVNNMTEGDVSG